MSNGPPKKDEAPKDLIHIKRAATPTINTAYRAASRAVSWWSVTEFVEPWLERAGGWPIAGTPDWCALGDDDSAKLAAVLDYARHWALRVETEQEAHAEASRDVSAAADWPAIAVEAKDLREFHAARPWLKRKAS